MKLFNALKLFFKLLSNQAMHKKVLLLAIPMVLSNITVSSTGFSRCCGYRSLRAFLVFRWCGLGGTMISVTLAAWFPANVDDRTRRAILRGERWQATWFSLVQQSDHGTRFAGVFLLLHSFGCGCGFL